MTDIESGSSKTTDYHLWSFQDDDRTMYVFTVEGRPEYSNLYYRMMSLDLNQVRACMWAIVATHNVLLWDNTEPIHVSDEAQFAFLRPEVL